MALQEDLIYGLRMAAYLIGVVTGSGLFAAGGYTLAVANTITVQTVPAAATTKPIPTIGAVVLTGLAALIAVGGIIGLSYKFAVDVFTETIESNNTSNRELGEGTFTTSEEEVEQLADDIEELRDTLDQLSEQTETIEEWMTNVSNAVDNPEQQQASG